MIFVCMLPQEVQNKNLTEIKGNKVYDNSCQIKKTSQDERPVCTLKKKWDRWKKLKIQIHGKIFHAHEWEEFIFL